MSTPVEISDLVHRYCDAVVHKNREQWASTWAPDGHWDLGSGRVIDGVDAIADYWVTAVDAFDSVVQLAHNGQATVDGDRGTGRWYISEHNQRRDGTTGLLLAFYLTRGRGDEPDVEEERFAYSDARALISR